MRSLPGEHSDVSTPVEPGITVYGAGGYLQREHVQDLAGPAVAAAADRCTGPSDEIAFFNIESEVEVVAD